MRNVGSVTIGTKINGNRNHVPTVPADIDSILEEFGPFNAGQRRYIADEYDLDTDNVLAKAAIVRSEPRDNLAKSFLAALRDDWKPKRSTKPHPKPKLPGGPVQEEFEMTDEQRAKNKPLLASVKEAVRGAGVSG